MKDFTKEISQKEMASFLLPIFFVKLFEQVLGITNTAIVSHLLEPKVMVCISACRIYPSIQKNLMGMTATGFGVYVTRYIGMQDPDRLKQAVRQAVFGAAALTLAGFCLLPVRRALFSLANIPADLYGQAGEYLFWLFAGSGALVFQNLFLSMLYGLGESAFAGGVSSFGVLLQPFLTFFFVKGIGLEISAVPAALMVNHLILAAIMLGYLLYKYPRLFGGAGQPFGGGIMWRELWNCGFSRAVMLTIVWCGTLMIQRKVNRMEDVYISAYMYAILVEDLFLTPVYACEQAASYVLAQNVGAGKAELVRKYHWRLNRLSWKFCLLLLPAVWLFGTECVRLVAGQASEEVAVCAGWWLRICVFAFPALSIDQIGRMSLQAVGDYRAMWALGLMEGILRTFLAVFVISDFHTLIGAFVCIFLCNGTAIGLCSHRAIKRLEKGAASGA